MLPGHQAGELLQVQGHLVHKREHSALQLAADTGVQVAKHLLSHAHAQMWLVITKPAGTAEPILLPSERPGCLGSSW